PKAWPNRSRPNCKRSAFHRSRSTRAATAPAGSTTASSLTRYPKAWFHCPSSVAELDPFAGLAAVLGTLPVQVDPHRQTRKGVPEVVYAAGKAPRLTLLAVRDLLEHQPAGRVLVSRASAEVID